MHKRVAKRKNYKVRLRTRKMKQAYDTIIAAWEKSNALSV